MCTIVPATLFDIKSSTGKFEKNKNEQCKTQYEAWYPQLAVNLSPALGHTWTWSQPTSAFHGVLPSSRRVEGRYDWSKCCNKGSKVVRIEASSGSSIHTTHNLLCSRIQTHFHGNSVNRKLSDISVISLQDAKPSRGHSGCTCDELE